MDGGVQIDANNKPYLKVWNPNLNVCTNSTLYNNNMNNIDWILYFNGIGLEDGNFNRTEMTLAIFYSRCETN